MHIVCSLYMYKNNCGLYIALFYFIDPVLFVYMFKVHSMDDNFHFLVQPFAVQGQGLVIFNISLWFSGLKYTEKNEIDD